MLTRFQKNRRFTNRFANGGFTLMELLITISMVAILTSIALPAFNESIARSRVTSNTNALVGAFNFARSEAIDRGVKVTVRPIATGWEIVADPGGVDEEQLKIFEPSDKGITITSGIVGGLTYEANGFRASGSSSSNLLVENSDSDTKRRVCVSVSGSIKVNDGGACN